MLLCRVLASNQNIKEKLTQQILLRRKTFYWNLMECHSIESNLAQTTCTDEFSMLEDILLKLVSAHFNATGVTLELVFSSVLVSGCGTQSSRIFLLWPSHVACVVISFRVIMHLLLDSLLECFAYGVGALTSSFPWYNVGKILFKPNLLFLLLLYFQINFIFVFFHFDLELWFFYLVKLIWFIA